MLLNTRCIDDTVKSEWWAEKPAGEARQFMELAHEWYARYMSRRANCFPIAYEELVRKRTPLREMFGFLEVDYDEEMVDGVLSVRHSYTTRAT